MSLFYIPRKAPAEAFPPLLHHISNDVVAIGGDLSMSRLLAAYRRGIFPWDSFKGEILWWSPDPRLVLFPEQIRITRSLRKRINNAGFIVTLDQAFEQVISQCAATREETWLNSEMQKAYIKLHNKGFAHSVETWFEGSLVGGFYGVSLGKIFFGESMFSLMNDASKVALARFCEQLQSWRFPLIDCQVHTSHLESLGAVEISRQDFLMHLNWCNTPSPNWALAFSEKI
jgi:leucyl/phenylalanyl-tRNA---protein transferase